MNNKLNILIVEDEFLIALELMDFIKSLGYNVIDYATNVKMAQILYKNNKNINLILMDINLNDKINGIELYKSLRTKASVIYTTSYIDDETISEAVSTNPLGYLVKIYNKDGLKALLELSLYKLNFKDEAIENLENLVDIGHGYFFDITKSELFFRNKHIHLTAKELQLLSLLITYKGQTVSIQTIRDEIYQDNPISESTIRTLIYRLRGKLEYKLIKNEFNYGISLNK